MNQTLRELQYEQAMSIASQLAGLRFLITNQVRSTREERCAIHGVGTLIERIQMQAADLCTSLDMLYEPVYQKVIDDEDSKHQSLARSASRALAATK